MQEITAPEILWRIFTLVESDADLARASRLNKFIGAAALDVLWNNITFQSFLSLFPTRTRTVGPARWDPPGFSLVEEVEPTNIVIPLLPSHWERANIYARRVKTLRHPWIDDMVQILTSLKLYDRGSETPCIFPKLQCLHWDYCSDIRELPLIANLFFSPTLQELSIRTHRFDDEDALPPSDSETFTVLPYRMSILVPLNVISNSDFPALKRLHLPLPAVSIESLRSYNAAVVSLLRHLSKGQLEEISLVLTRNILCILHTFPNLHSLELYDRDLPPSSPLDWGTWKRSENITAFEKLRSLKLLNLSSVSSLDHLQYFQCAPSHRMKVYFSSAFENNGVGLFHHFGEIIHLLHPRTNTLESLEIYSEGEGVVDLTTFLDWLFTLPNLRELGGNITLNLDNDTLSIMSTKWRKLTRLFLPCNGTGLVSLSGIVSLNRCPIRSLVLPIHILKDEVDVLYRQIENSEIAPLYSLEELYMVDSDSDFGPDIAGVVFVLAYLFPHAIIEPSSNTLREVLRTRAVVLEMLKKKNLARLTQMHQEKKYLATAPILRNVG